MPSDTDNEIQLLHLEAKKLMDTGAEKYEIITALQKKGISVDYAEMIIENVYGDIHKNKEFWKHIVSGSLIVIATIIANYSS